MLQKQLINYMLKKLQSCCLTLKILFSSGTGCHKNSSAGILKPNTVLKFNTGMQYMLAIKFIEWIQRINRVMITT